MPFRDTVNVAPLHTLTVIAGTQACNISSIDAAAVPSLLHQAVAGETYNVPPVTTQRMIRIDSAAGDYDFSVAPASMADIEAAVVAALGYTPMDPAHITFPTEDPQVAGEWWDNAGTLTKSTGPA